MSFGEFPPKERDLGAEPLASSRPRLSFVSAFAIGAGLFLSGVALGAAAPNFFGDVSREGSLARNAALIGEAFRASIFGGRETGQIIDIPLGETKESSTEQGEGAATPGNGSAARPKDSAGTGFGNAETKPKALVIETKVPPPSSSSSLLPAEKSPDSAIIPECSWISALTPTHDIVFHEIAWMGSPAESASAGSANEWVEVRNTKGLPFPLRGLRLFLGSGSGAFLASSSAAIPSFGLALFERSDDGSVPNIPADGIFTGSLSNAGAWLRLFDSDCRLLDEVDARSGWPAGVAATKHTMARRNDLSWFTSGEVGGTPRRENTLPVASPTASAPLPPPAPTSSPPATRTLFLAVVRAPGATGGIVGGGVDCSAECAKVLPQGTTLELTAAPGAESSFLGWSGACSGAGPCTVTLTGDMSLSAEFALVLPPPPPPPTSGGVAIMEVMAGRDGAAADEFVELLNSGATAVDLSGWMVKKRSSTGSETTLLAASRLTGKSIPPGKRFLLGNEGGYAGSVALDAAWATSNVLAYANNAVILYDGAGSKVDEAAWADIPAGSSIVRSTPGGVFEVSATPSPENSSQ